MANLEAEEKISIVLVNSLELCLADAKKLKVAFGNGRNGYQFIDYQGAIQTSMRTVLDATEKLRKDIEQVKKDAAMGLGKKSL